MILALIVHLRGFLLEGGDEMSSLATRENKEELHGYQSQFVPQNNSAACWAWPVTKWTCRRFGSLNDEVSYNQFQ